jgi:hypothetical protein
MELIEQLFGSGEVFDDDENIGKINYRLWVYQEIVEGEKGLKNTIGKIDSDMAFGLFDKGKLRLKLEDGRNIEFFVRNLEGDIQCSGGFFE